MTAAILGTLPIATTAQTNVALEQDITSGERWLAIAELVDRPTTAAVHIGPAGSLTLLTTPEGYPTPVPRSDLQLESTFAPVLKFKSGIKLPDLASGSDAEFAWGFKPAVTFRIFNEPSSPIYSPSFQPSLFFERSSVDLVGSTGARVFGWGLALSHHSNGGSGCEFTDEIRRVRDGKWSCVIDPDSVGTPLEQRRIRVRDGNFTTNYLEASVHLGRFWRNDHGTVSTLRGLMVGRLTVEYHAEWIPHPFGSPGSSEFLAFYARLRPRLDLAGQFLGRPGEREFRVRTRLSVEYTGRPDIAPNDGAIPFQIGGGLTVGHVRWMKEWSAGVDFFVGQDDYNVEFVRNIRSVSFVLSWHPFPSRLR